MNEAAFSWLKSKDVSIRFPVALPRATLGRPVGAEKPRTDAQHLESFYIA